jgi:hypothetical protein
MGRSKRIRGRGVLVTSAFGACLTNLPAQAQRSPSPSEDRVIRNPAEAAVTSYPAQAAGDGGTVGGFNLSRWAEDWRSMRDPKRRADALDRLKYLPLDGSGDVFLTLSGELRLRVNQTTNPELREQALQRQDINRIVGGADLHLGPHLRVYGELAHGGIAGVNIGVPVTTNRNDLIVLQSFVEGRAAVKGIDVGARIGRQTFTDGSNLLTSQRDNNTIQYVLNGTRAWVRGRRLRADVFDFHATAYGAGGTGDDTIDRNRRFSGITAGIVLPSEAFGGSKLYLDPFVWRLRNSRAKWGAVTSLEERTYYGARLWGDVGRVTIDWTVNHQAGRFDDRDLSAWQAFIAQTWHAGSAKQAPLVGLHVDYASGGGSYGKGTLRTAYAPFGNNIYYSYQLFLTPTNLVAVAPNVTVSPDRRLRLTLEYQRAWRANSHDAVYRANGSAFAGTQTTGADRIADSLRGQVVWTASRRLSFTGRYEHLIAGPALTRAGYANSDFLAAWASFRF